MEMKNIIYILLFCLSFCNEFYEYKIKSFGIPVAECTMAIKDTIYNNEKSILLNFTVNTINVFDRLYPVNNKYSIIINNENSTTYFQKYTIQPRIINSIETEIKDDKVLYKNSDYSIPSNSFNIFSLLYLLMNSPEQINFNDENLLEREGKFYSYSVAKNGGKYELNILSIDDDEGLIKNTDIFTWAIFKENVKRYIYINDNRIDKCIVKSGILNFTLEYIQK